ncbi:unnamed protein product [Brugia pahangi]|uniref:Reverse transcriptase domain-containing protein n=1 Tax=Brugia pahangi TaxID=6280 RepID=A0A0N4TAU9_BRUPA|nr:unnamed protein product [Brugia pahangi]
MGFRIESSLINVLNLYQNRLGRSLLRTDISCIPGRYELELCNLVPKKLPIYCNLAKLACEADLMLLPFIGSKNFKIK